VWNVTVLAGVNDVITLPSLMLRLTEAILLISSISALITGVFSLTMPAGSLFDITGALSSITSNC